MSGWRKKQIMMAQPDEQNTTWQGLTYEEIKKASLKAGMQEHYMGFHSGFIRFADEISAILKEKNTNA